ncbi:DUF5687 family protein [Flavobacteriaceae bacterium F08102]|nr:DUF5687 family protein [Flavobacteriaceae bacterium F08102]
MILRFANLEWKQFFRSSYWQKSMALNVLMVIFALYFILIFLGLGLGLYPLLRELYPESDPFVMVNRFLFFWLLTDLGIRFFLQKLPVMNVKPLLVLPLKTSKIIHYVLRKSALSFFNFLPMFTAIPFGIMLLLKGYAPWQVITWNVLILLLTLLINYLNFIIERLSSKTELSFLPIIALISGVFALNYFGLISFENLVERGVNSIVQNPLYLLIPFALLVGLYRVNYISLKENLYIDQSLKSKTKEANTTDLKWTRRFGSVAPFLQLDLKLIWRNKRPRSTVFILIMGLLYGLIFYPNPHYQDMQWLYVFVGIFVTGVFMINFGQFIPAWDSGYYKLLMSQNIKYKEYLTSKYLLMQMSAVIMFVLSIPYVYFGWDILLIHFAAMIFNIGVNSHILLFGGSFNRKRIDLNQRAAFNYQGTGAVQWLIGFPLLLLPMLFFYVPYHYLGFEAGIATVIIIGVIGVVFHQKIMQMITAKYIDSKYAMIDAFEQTN